MLDLIENIQTAVEPAYTFGVNAVEHGPQNFCSFSFLTV